MTNSTELSGPELYLEVAKVIGLEAPKLVRTNRGVFVYYIAIYDDGDQMRLPATFNPETNADDFMRVLSYASLSGDNWFGPSHAPSNPPRHWVITTDEGRVYHGYGPDDVVALCRAVVRLGR